MQEVMSEFNQLIAVTVPKQTAIEAEHILVQLAELYNMLKEKDLFLHSYWVRA